MQQEVLNDLQESLGSPGTGTLPIDKKQPTSVVVIPTPREWLAYQEANDDEYEEVSEHDSANHHSSIVESGSRPHSAGSLSDQLNENHSCDDEELVILDSNENVQVQQ